MKNKGKIFSLIALSGAMLFSFAIFGKNFDFLGVRALGNKTVSPNKTVVFEGTPKLISSGATSRYSTEAISDENTHLYLILDTVTNPGKNPIAFGPNSTKSSFFFSEYKNGKNEENNDEPYKFRNVSSIYFDELSRSFFVDAYKFTNGSYESSIDPSMSTPVSTTATKSIEVNKKLCHRFDCRGQSVYDVFCPRVVLSYVCDSSETPRECTSISLSGEYQTTFYQYATFNHDGLVIKANYTDGTSEEITNSPNITISGGSTFTIGAKTVTVKYNCDDGEFTDSYQINVVPEPKVTGIDVTVPTEAKRFFVNDTFSHDTVEVIATYDNGDKVDVSNEASFTTPDLSTAGGMKQVTVSFGGKSFNYYVTAYKKLISLSFDISNAKTTYLVGETLSFENVKVYAHFNNNTQTEVTSSAVFPTPITFTEPNSAYQVVVSYTSNENPSQSITVDGSYNVVVNPIPTYSLSASETINGTMFVAEGEYEEGQEIEVLVEADPGYVINEVYYNDHIAITGNDGDYYFDMPACNVTIYATFKIPEHDSYHVSLNYNNAQGNVVMDEEGVFDYSSGDDVGFTINPVSGYEIDTVTFPQGVEYDNEGNYYYFVMPEENVTVSIIFKASIQPVTTDTYYVQKGLVSKYDLYLYVNSDNTGHYTIQKVNTTKVYNYYFDWKLINDVYCLEVDMDISDELFAGNGFNLTNEKVDYKNQFTISGSSLTIDLLDTANMDSGQIVTMFAAEGVLAKWQWLLDGIVAASGDAAAAVDPDEGVTDANKSFWIPAFNGFFTQTQHEDTNFKTVSANFADAAVFAKACSGAEGEVEVQIVKFEDNGKTIVAKWK